MFSWWSARGFARHNKKIWKDFPQGGNDSEVLVEFNSWDPLLGFSYLAPILAKEFQSNIRSFMASPKRGTFGTGALQLSVVRAGFFLNLFSNVQVYKSFGVQPHILVPIRAHRLATKAKKLSEEFFLTDPDNRTLENFAIENVLIGDLIYDTYLRQNAVATINLSDPRFRKFFRQSVQDFLFWLNYVSGERVAAVITSHSSYTLAFPLRVAMARGIPSFVAGTGAMYRVSMDRPHAGCEFLDYPEFFDNLGKSEKDRLLKQADTVLQDRFEGFVGEGSDISKISAQNYRRQILGQALFPTGKTKVLVALHAFSDSPHWGGRALFPDYWEWVWFLANWSEKSPFEWYVKCHPDSARHGDLPLVNTLLLRFPHLNLLSGQVTHHQLVDEGIDAVLTVHGTIGFEYALLGVPVVNASTINPHIRYPFNYHPQTIRELALLLENLHKLKKPTEQDKDRAREYFAVKNHMKRHLLVEHLGDFVPRAKAFRPIVRNLALQRRLFVRTFERNRHLEEIKKISSFVKSGQYFLN